MRVKFGDILEISTKSGLYYAMYTHRSDAPPVFGALIRIFDEEFTSRPTNFSSVVTKDLRFSVFYPVQAAVNKKVVEIVASLPIPEKLQSFPVFRCGIVNPKTGKSGFWRSWDGETYRPIGRELTDEQRKWPIQQVWNHTMLVRRLEERWRPEQVG